MRESLPDVLRLAAEVLREPAFPDKEFEELRLENLAAIEQQKSEPNALAPNAFQRHMNPYPKGDVRYVQSLDEAHASYKAATLDEAKAFYAGFYGASTGELAVVGDFDAAQTAALAAELFGGWKSPARYERVPQVYHEVAAENRSLETPDKANAFFIAGQNLPLATRTPTIRPSRSATTCSAAAS